MLKKRGSEKDSDCLAAVSRRYSSMVI